jgi:hypothetical protein
VNVFLFFLICRNGTLAYALTVRLPMAFKFKPLKHVSSGFIYIRMMTPCVICTMSVVSAGVDQEWPTTW